MLYFLLHCNLFLRFLKIIMYIFSKKIIIPVCKRYVKVTFYVYGIYYIEIRGKILL